MPTSTALTITDDYINQKHFKDIFYYIKYYNDKLYFQPKFILRHKNRMIYKKIKSKLKMLLTLNKCKIVSIFKFQILLRI